MTQVNKLLPIAAVAALIAVLAWLASTPGADPDVTARQSGEHADTARAGDEDRIMPVADAGADGVGEAVARAQARDNADVAVAPRADDPATYAAALDEVAAVRWETFRRRHPGVDPTDDGAFHEAVLAERAQYPASLTPRDRDVYGTWLAGMEALREAMVAERARIAGLELRGTMPDGRDFALTGFHGTEPVIQFTENREAAVSTAASFVRRNSGFDAIFGPSVDGSGFFANINDSGTIAASLEFRNDAGTAWRRTNIRGSSDSEHGTHVAGTVAARGLENRAMGMAPAAHLYGFSQQQTSDVLNHGMDWPGRPARSIVGNTSLGSSSGTLNGVYTSTSASFDSALHDTPYYLHFYSAGNSGPDFFSLTTSRKDGKNLFAVANVSDVTRNASAVRTGGGALRTSSSRGPTRDGRVKPDIAANGVSLYSPDRVGGYSTRTGTSMASPNAAGSAILLQDYFSKRLGGNLMRASTLMALIINTAEDLGTAGPDYAYGWGLMNTLEAARVVQRHANSPRTRPIREEILHQGGTHTFSYQPAGAGPLRATLAWTDPPGPARSNASQTEPVLMNDLNLRLIGPDGTTHLPFVMPYVTGSTTRPPFSEDLLGAQAVTGVNSTDNKIQVLVNAPQQGVWWVEVSHARALTGGSQHYSLVLGGLESTLVAAPPQISAHTNSGVPGQDFAPIEILGDGFILGAEVWFRREGHAPVKAYAVETTGGRILARVDHAAMAEGEWTLVVRNPDGLETAGPQVYQVSPDALPTYVWTGGADGAGRLMMASAGYANWFPTLENASVAAGSASQFHIASRNGGGAGARIGDGGHLGLNASARAGILVFDDISGHFPDDLRIAANVSGNSARQCTFDRPDTTIIKLTSETTGRVTMGHERAAFGNLGIRLPASGTNTIDVAHPAATLDLSGLFDNTSATFGSVNYGRGAIHAGNTDPAAPRARLRKTGAGTLDLRTADTHGNRMAGLTIAGGVVVIGKNPDMGWEPPAFMADHVVIDGGALHFDAFTANTGETRGFQIAGGGAVLHVTGQNHGVAGVVGDLPGHVGHVVKTGEAALRFYGENSYSGGTEVREGRMRYTTAKSLGSGPVTLLEGASLAAWVDGVVLPNPLVIADADVRFGGDGAETRVAGAVDLGGETRVLHLDDNARFDGPLGNGGLVVAGASPTNVLHLAGVASLAGPVMVRTGVLEISGAVDAERFEVGDGAVLRAMAGSNLGGDSAAMTLAGGTLEVGAREGGLAVASLQGAGAVAGDLAVRERIKPTAGQLAIDGNLTLQASATLRLAADAGFATPGLSVTGAALLEGTLSLGFAAASSPETDIVFHLLDAPDGGIILGPDFHFDLPPLIGDLVWDVADFANTGNIRAIDAFTLWAENAGLSGADADPDADPDGDGLNNRLEYLLGFDPTDANSTLRMTLEGGVDGLFLQINRVIPDGEFVVETSSDLDGIWAVHATLSVEETEDAFLLPVVAGDVRRFYRLRFIPPAP